MTRRLYATEPQGHGGRRRFQVAPMLSPEQVELVRAERAKGTPYKVLMRWIHASRETLSRAANGTRTYKRCGAS